MKTRAIKFWSKILREIFWIMDFVLVWKRDLHLQIRTHSDRKWVRESFERRLVRRKCVKSVFRVRQHWVRAYCVREFFSFRWLFYAFVCKVCDQQLPFPTQQFTESYLQIFSLMVSIVCFAFLLCLCVLDVHLKRVLYNWMDWSDKECVA